MEPTAAAAPFDGYGQGLAHSAIEGTFVPVAGENVASVLLDGEAVLLQAGSGRPFRLDAIGAVVWACMDGSSNVDAITTDLSREFGADPTTVRADVLDLVGTMEREGLIQGPADVGRADHDEDHDAGLWPQSAIETHAPRFLVEPPSS